MDLAWVNIEDLPKKDYRQAAYFAGDIRELARRCGAPTPQSGKNDLGEYQVLGLLIDGVPIRLVGLTPFLTTEFSVFSDPLDAENARQAVIRLLAAINYNAEEIKDIWK